MCQTPVWHGVRRLRIAKFSRSDVSVTVSGRTFLLTREEAETLLERLSDALTDRVEFVHTVGTHRADGSYRVSRLRGNSAGHAKVFGSFRELERLFERVPREFTADDVDHPGVTNTRRHLVVRHLAEHPAFPCELVRRQPLTVRKTVSPSTP